MKRVTASDARKNWFRLLDEVAAGAVVSIERGGRTILLKRAPSAKGLGETPDYHALVRADHLDQADRWGWEWTDPGEDLRSEDSGDA